APPLPPRSQPTPSLRLSARCAHYCPHHRVRISVRKASRIATRIPKAKPASAPLLPPPRRSSVQRQCPPQQIPIAVTRTLHVLFPHPFGEGGKRVKEHGTLSSLVTDDIDQELLQQDAEFDRFIRVE
ncbi:hypothetical protein HN51_032433, partial [Arachis hypogaea]